MTQMVYIENGRTVTDSLQVAHSFGKKHNRVMQDIRELACSPEFREHNFVRSSYQTAQRKSAPKYIITQDGFAMLAMGYTGSTAMRFKEMYIAEFNRMAGKLNGNPANLQAILQATQNLLSSQTVIIDRMNEVENKVDSQITLNSGQQRALQQAVNKKVCSIEPVSEERRDLFRQIHKEIKDRWQVPSYKDVLRQDLQEVLDYIKAWVPVRRIEV
ncbi:Rha family transcriptional regulator [Paenibacillus shenyangensis]|uniref:Rha family transcriptional regulator n=1 Tax=Paenibacillus sp. A9 TaxID=1284352 RepID=UPI0003732447|nr:Rha family transcriptional regulator [Paenibacillus sp. A9]